MNEQKKSLLVEEAISTIERIIYHAQRDIADTETALYNTKLKINQIDLIIGKLKDSLEEEKENA